MLGLIYDIGALKMDFVGPRKPRIAPFHMGLQLQPPSFAGLYFGAGVLKVECLSFNSPQEPNLNSTAFKPLFYLRKSSFSCRVPYIQSHLPDTHSF